MAQKFKPSAPIKTTASAAPKAAEPAAQPVGLLFDKSNYVYFLVSALVVAFGFVIMSGTTDIYSTTKIVIAPIVVLAGFGLGFYAILKKPATK